MSTARAREGRETPVDRCRTRAGSIDDIDPYAVEVVARRRLRQRRASRGDRLSRQGAPLLVQGGKPP
jgi:hypothetical protein